MAFWPDLKRLRSVRDVTTLPGHSFIPHEATPWYVATFINPGPLFITDRSVTVTVISNRFLTWYRTYTKDGTRPPRLSSGSFFQVDEWVPGNHPSLSQREEFTRFGTIRRKAISWLNDTDHVSHWSEQAKRHLKVFKKTPGIRIRQASLEELLVPFSRSQVPDDFREVFVHETQRHLAAHPEAIDIVAVEHEKLGIIAGFVGANCLEASQSVYLLGFFVPEAAKMYPMMGLFDWWFLRCKELGFASCNFGNIVGPHPNPFDAMIGFSNFKTHFGVTRVWQPGNYWRLSRGQNLE